MTNKYSDFEFNGETNMPKPLNADDYDSLDSFIDALNANMVEKERYAAVRESEYYGQGYSDEKHMAGEAGQGSVDAFLEEFRLDDPVNNPEHYTIGSIETIDYITDVLGEYHAAIFCHGNVLKYTGTRLFGKGKPIQDAKKAVWYLNKMIELLEFTEDTNW